MTIEEIIEGEQHDDPAVSYLATRIRDERAKAAAKDQELSQIRAVLRRAETERERIVGAHDAHVVDLRRLLNGGGP